MNLNSRNHLEKHIDIRRIEAILGTNIFSQDQCHNPLVESAFIEIMIRLRDLVHKTNEEINFNDDIITGVFNGIKVRTISDCIKYIRDATCHINSKKNNYKDNDSMSCFNRVYGRGAEPSGLLSSDYSDDVCFFYGQQKIYLKRHIIRFFEESKKYLKNLDAK